MNNEMPYPELLQLFTNNILNNAFSDEDTTTKFFNALFLEEERLVSIKRVEELELVKQHLRELSQSQTPQVIAVCEKLKKFHPASCLNIAA